MKTRNRRIRYRMPRIGITPDLGTWDSGSKAEPLVFLRERYPRAILQAGGLPLVLPITHSEKALQALVVSLDGIIVSGGDFDIHPKFYGEKPLPALGKINDDRTEFELEVIALALKRGLPLLGICGGAQAINVTLGGSLIQDIETQVPKAMQHRQGNLREVGGHAIGIYEKTKLRQIVRRSCLEVNTTHHQAVKELGKGLVASAASADGVIEAVESENDSFVLGVQWHPEFLTHKDLAQRRIFTAFVEACRR